MTEKAKQYREKYDLISDKMNKIFYDGFTEDEIISFENQLRRIIKNLEKEGV